MLTDKIGVYMISPYDDCRWMELKADCQWYSGNKNTNHLLDFFIFIFFFCFIYSDLKLKICLDVQLHFTIHGFKFEEY